MGNAFIVDGIVYCIDSYSQIHQTINLLTTQHIYRNIDFYPWTNGSDYMASCTISYNGMLYSWTMGSLYIHIAPTNSEITGALSFALAILLL